MQDIRLPEHWSSRLLFIENTVLNNGRAELQIEETDEGGYSCDCHGIVDRFLISKLNKYIWLVEDCGTYDTNHYHTANIYYIDPTSLNKVILYHITRDMEYDVECDRMYTTNGGSNKVSILDDKFENLTANFYLKYEKNIPPCKEEVEKITEDDIDKYYIYLYNYSSSNQIGIVDALSVNNKLEDIESRLFIEGNPINKLNLLDINITNVQITTSQLSVKYDIPENTSNDFKVGFINIDSTTDKFISNYIKPYAPESTYFIIQPPKNRSWIYYRLLSTEHDIGNPFGYYYGKYNIDSHEYYRYPLGMSGIGIQGHYGTFNNDNNTYTYEINLDRSNDSIGNYLFLPIEVCDYKSMKFYNSSDEEISWDGNMWTPGDYFFNDIDGRKYRFWWFYHTTRIYKIILTYNINNDN